ncbi:hypothetical protein BMQ_pBM70176 (plasmid) [Priestia megaterium QM B1551]|uniref:Uncharacterized protein n=1 Tax=Priestia megaterium (strain ATCC 12872 / QMB1551) TaxID=545693 RepID=D5E4J1_PRIM1|nr:hypothetical protein BMQ_pBM70176 [Priestia megaterium QM B1551]
MSPRGSLHFEVFFEKNKAEASDFFIFVHTFMSKTAIWFYLQYK